MDKKKPVLPEDQEKQIKLQNPSTFYRPCAEYLAPYETNSQILMRSPPPSPRAPSYRQTRSPAPSSVPGKFSRVRFLAICLYNDLTEGKYYYAKASL